MRRFYVILGLKWEIAKFHITYHKIRFFHEDPSGISTPNFVMTEEEE